MTASPTLLPPAAGRERPLPLSDDTMVVWDDGSVCRFGDLMIQDRKTVEFNPTTQRYEGGYGL